jgi:2-(1,2-epoxy-1,2-dihydrophenyl)acetyl-CoA isomerase
MGAAMSLVRIEPLGAGVIRLVLARPGMQNALVPELLNDLLAALRDIARSSDCAAVVLAADGPAFSIGGDMRRFQRERERGDLQAYGHRAWSANSTKPSWR